MTASGMIMFGLEFVDRLCNGWLWEVWRKSHTREDTNLERALQARTYSHLLRSSELKLVTIIEILLFIGINHS